MNKAYFLIVFAVVSIAQAAPQEEADLLLEEEISTSYDTPLSAGLDLLYVPTRYPNYQWGPTDRTTEVGKGVQLSLEWLPLGRIENQYGKPGIGGSVGFRQISNVALTAHGGAKGHLYTNPFGAFVSYRADFFERQVLVPYGKVGIGMMLANQDAELPEGVNSSHYTFWSFDYAVGLEFCMNVLDRKSARSLDATTGINSTYLMFEYYNSTSLTASNDRDLSHGEYRLGLRFEI